PPPGHSPNDSADKPRFKRANATSAPPGSGRGQACETVRRGRRPPQRTDAQGGGGRPFGPGLPPGILIAGQCEAEQDGRAQTSETVNPGGDIVCKPEGACHEDGPALGFPLDYGCARFIRSC